jgi:hypothetical protein
MAVAPSCNRRFVVPCQENRPPSGCRACLDGRAALAANRECITGPGEGKPWWRVRLDRQEERRGVGVGQVSDLHVLRIPSSK